MPTTSAVALAIEHFIEDITDLPVGHPLDDVLETALIAEHELRLLFASGPDNPLLGDKFIGLFDIFGLHPAARQHRARQIDPESTNLHDKFLFPIPANKRFPSLEPSTVHSIEAFGRNWEIFTQRALVKMTPEDWKNVVAAGGSVLACIRRSNSNSSAKQLNDLYQSNVYGSSDIDLFLWGLTPEEAEKKMQDIYWAVSEATAFKVTCVRKANTVSIHAAFPYRPIQIILRLYQSPAEILAGFDIDSACCAYDGGGTLLFHCIQDLIEIIGKRVWANPRFLAALVRQRNTIDLTRRSPSYEVRLAKYAQRGFEISVPSLRRDLTKRSLYSRDLDAFPNGLARLIVLEAAYIRPGFYKHLRFPWKPHYLQRPLCDALAKHANDLPSNNYDGNLGWAQIPYGKHWDADKIEDLISKKSEDLLTDHSDRIIAPAPFNPWNEHGTVHRHIFFAGSMQQCLQGLCPDCNSGNVGNSPSTSSGIYIQGPLRFITVNPGQQLSTGSFKPITVGDWTAETYEDLDIAANSAESRPERPFTDLPGVGYGLNGWLPGRFE